MEKRPDPQTRIESKMRLVEQINTCLHSGNYSRALDLLRGPAAEFPDDPDLSELEKRAHEGVQRNAEAQRLITESQELFAQRKSAEAIQLLRQAYELDKNNSLARSILANALVEHAQSILETDWLEAETLTNQALALNPAHPTAKMVLGLIVVKKETSPVEDWVSQTRKLQSSGDLFAALAWVAEGLAVHPHDPKLLLIQDEIQRDQDTRRRQARRGDLEDLRCLQREIDEATDVAAKQALAVRIQTVAAKYWTDGEILSIANALLLRLGLVSQESSSTSPRGKGATVILHVPRPGSPKPSAADTGQGAASIASSANVPPAVVAPSKDPPSVAPPGKIPNASPQPQFAPPPAATVPVAAPSAPVAKLTIQSPEPRQTTRSKAKVLVLISASAGIILFAAIFYFAREHRAPATATHSAGPVSAPVVSDSVASGPNVSGQAASVPVDTTPGPSSSSFENSSGTAEEVTGDQPAAASGQNVGTLVVVAGQDRASVFLNGKLQPQLTRGGQLRLPNLELKDYVVQVSKNGFQNPPAQKIRIRRGELTRLVFNLQPQILQPQPRLSSLTIQGGTPETTVLVDQTVVGAIQHDGTLTLATVNPGDHTVELRKEGYRSRQFKEHFVEGGTISLAAADAALEAASGELKITFTPADATVAIARGELLKIVSSGVPINLAAGTYTLTARTAERFTRSSTLEVIAGRSKTLDLSLAPGGMSKWDDPGAWKHEKDSFTRKGGDFVLYGVTPASGTFLFSAMPAKGHLLQWVLNYTDSRNYVLCQMDDNNFSRTVIRNGEKTEQAKIPEKGDKRGFRTLQIRVSATELVHVIKHGDSWAILDRWTQPGTNLSLGKFGFYLPGNDQITLSSFAHYADLNIH